MGICNNKYMYLQCYTCMYFTGISILREFRHILLFYVETK